MAVNLCLAHHCPKITCSQVASDGYEVDNLISHEHSKKRQGFRAEYFIKAPVDITLQFPGAIEISHIVLGMRHGTLQVTGIEIWTKLQIDSEVYFPVGKCFTSDALLVCFVNKSYRPRGQFQQFAFELPDGGETRYLHGKSRSHLTEVNHVMIRISRMANSSVPALSSLEVWGQAGTTYAAGLAYNIVEAEKKALILQKDVAENFSESTTDGIEDDGEDSVEGITAQENDAEIPPEFIDPITCEVMALPVLLPSGQSVDRSTLEKYLETESRLGRAPRNPFTGVRFETGKQPVPNVALKARIDQFLVKNPSLSKDVPRTLGRHPNNSVRDTRTTGVVNKPCCSTDSAMTERQSSSESTQKLAPSSADLKRSDNSISRKTDKANVEKNRVTPSTSKSKHSEDSYDVNVKKQKASSKRKFNSTVLENGEGDTSIRSHERRLSESLDASLKLSLSGLRTFSEPAWTSTLSASRPLSKCSSCSKDLEGGRFALPCSHLLCRSCLVEKKESGQQWCNDCKEQFKPSDLILSHQ